MATESWDDDFAEFDELGHDLTPPLRSSERKLSSEESETLRYAAEFNDGPTLKLPKVQRLRPRLTPDTFTSPFKTKAHPPVIEEELDGDVLLPGDDEPLKLSTRFESSPDTHTKEDLSDLEWPTDTSSLGTRFAGVKRYSNQSSVRSPSLSSFNDGSEDLDLDGLDIPLGPLKLADRHKNNKVVWMVSHSYKA